MSAREKARPKSRDAGLKLRCFGCLEGTLEGSRKLDVGRAESSAIIFLYLQKSFEDATCFPTIAIMTTMLGKRKRKAPEPKRAEREASADSSGPDVEDAQAIFKRFFEAQFKPLPEVKRKAVKVVEEVEKDDDDDDEDDWEGISEEEGMALELGVLYKADCGRWFEY